MPLKQLKPKAQNTPSMSGEASSMRIRVALVEDDERLRTALSDFIGQRADLQLAAACPDAEAAMLELPAQKPDVVLMDINLPGMNGLECVLRLKTLLPQAQFMMLTVYEDDELVFRSLAAGATGYLLKRSSPVEIALAIHDLYAGGSPITPQIARLLVQYYSRQPLKPAPGGAADATGVGELSPHQRAFLEQLAQGALYKEIADNLGISMGGVRSYVRRIYEKLQVHSRTEAVMKYLGR